MRKLTGMLLVFYIYVAFCLVLLLLPGGHARADEPPPIKGFSAPGAEPPPIKGFVPPVPVRERFTATDGTVYELCDDGIYRAVAGAPGVAPKPTFRTGQYHAGHNCPSCGFQSPPGQGTWIVRGTNSNGTHWHECPLDGARWFH